MKGKTNTRALVKAQDEIEALMSNFEIRDFVAKIGLVTVVLKGNLKLESVTPETGVIDSVSFKSAYDEALAELEKERSISLARVRNKIIKEFKFDIKDLIPEIAKAIAYLDAIQKTH
jgi:DNA-binding protein YbaB